MVAPFCKKAVELTLIPSATISPRSVGNAPLFQSRKSVSYTCIWFWVKVPVLSVQITVMAPIVSQACILRTRLLVDSIRRMFSARLSVTLIGKPSGTATTISVTAIIK